MQLKYNHLQLTLNTQKTTTTLIHAHMFNVHYRKGR